MQALVLFFPQFLMKLRSSSRAGFTLIELLLVIGIIAILASIVIVAINPTKQLGDARNAQRRSDVNTVLNAVYQYAIDNNGTLPSCISGTTALLGVCTSGSDCTSYAGGPATGCNLDVLTGTYLVRIPLAPSGAPSGTTAYTGYDIQKGSNGRVTVSAPEAEQGASISVTR